MLTSEVEDFYIERVAPLCREIEFQNFDHIVVVAGYSEDRAYIEIQADRQDTFSGEWSTGYGGKRYLSPEMTDSQIVRAIFGAFLAYQEHEVREAFTYKGRRIFGPHSNIEALWAVAEVMEWDTVESASSSN